MSRTTPRLERLIGLIKTLRGKDGCPWDRRQTPRSLARYLLEEAHELAHAVNTGTPEDVCEELGDVLFQVLFIAELFTESGGFDLERVFDRNIEKMTRRHPHVFGNHRAETTAAVRKTWNQIKQKERAHAPDASILASIPARLSSQLRAYRISERAAGVGFDWKNMAGVLEKVEEEWQELKNELNRGHGEIDRRAAAMEFGDLLFTLANVARFAGFHPETALTQATHKFESRFRHMEKQLRDSGRSLDTLSFDEMQVLWDQAKKAVPA